MKPLLSICIPTYNRSDILHDCIESIVTDEDFDSEVELVISDNCSTDETRCIVKKFIDKYPNIKYFYNEKNIRDRNFLLALQRGTGEYRKLQNDYLGLLPGSLKIMKEYLHKYHGRNVFFSGDFLFTKPHNDIIECNDMDDYIKTVSTFVTYIPLFGLWEENLSKIKEPYRYTELLLNQVDWTYQLLQICPKSVVINIPIYKGIQGKRTIKRSVKYNWFHVHVKNYYDIISQYVNRGDEKNARYISKGALKKDKDNCLYHFTREFVFSYIYKPTNFPFKTEGTTSILFRYMYDVPRFYLYMLSIPFLYCAYPLLVLKFTSSPAKRKIKKILVRMGLKHE